MTHCYLFVKLLKAKTILVMILMKLKKATPNLTLKKLRKKRNTIA